jgi:isoleucyl-tRNA synthetase
LAERYERLLELRGEATRALEEARKAGVLKQASEARITLSAPAATLALARGAAELRSMLLAGEVVLAEGSAVEARVERAAGEKCERCWYTRALGAHPEHPTLCERCAGVVA